MIFAIPSDVNKTTSDTGIQGTRQTFSVDTFDCERGSVTLTVIKASDNRIRF